MSEKLENIKNGSNIELDGVTVLNNISIAEKEKEEVKPSEEAKKALEEPKPIAEESNEVSNEEITPDVPIIQLPPSEDKTIIPKVNDVIPNSIDPIAIDIANAPISNPQTSIEPQVVPPFNSFETPTTESFSSNNTFQTDSEVSMPFNTFNQNDNSMDDFGMQKGQFNSYQSNFDNFSNNQLSNDISTSAENALNTIKDEIMRLSKENKDLIIENSTLRETNKKLEESNNNLATQNKILQDKMSGMQNRLLDMFGMGNINQNTNSFNQNVYNDNGINNGGNRMVA